MLFVSVVQAAPPVAPEAAVNAIAGYKKSLKEALLAGLKDGAPAAIDICAMAAPKLAAAASSPKVTLGRSALKLRNPANAPRPWVAQAMKELAAKPVDGERRVVALEGGKVGVAETIVVAPMCLACHGASLAEPVAKTIKAKYPKDAATGYAAGDFRGVFWAEVTP